MTQLPVNLNPNFQKRLLQENYMRLTTVFINAVALFGIMLLNLGTTNISKICDRLSDLCGGNLHKTEVHLGTDSTTYYIKSELTKYDWS